MSSVPGGDEDAAADQAALVEGVERVVDALERERRGPDRVVLGAALADVVEDDLCAAAGAPTARSARNRSRHSTSVSPST